MSLYPKNPVGPIPIGIIVFFGVFMVDPTMIFSKGKEISPFGDFRHGKNPVEGRSHQGGETLSDSLSSEALLSRKDILLP